MKDATPVSFESYDGSPPENYERYFVPAIGEPLARRLVAAADLREGERVLDVACGTGVVARLAAAEVGADGAVAGVDLEPGMIAAATAATPGEPTIEWHRADAGELPLPDRSFDAVLCQMGLQFMADKPAALREMRRVLDAGGRLALNVPGPAPEPFARLAEILADRLRPQAAGFVHAVFSLHDPDQLRSLVAVAGFEDVACERSTASLRVPPPREFLWQYVRSTPLTAPLAQAGAETRTQIERDVAAAWEPFAEDGAMRLDVGVTTATARRA
jgi:ubiquinone/menaquinone biosynthesis C-methylase UbiE